MSRNCSLNLRSLDEQVNLDKDIDFGDLTQSKMRIHIDYENGKEYEQAHYSASNLCCSRFIAAMVIMVTIMALAASLITRAWRLFHRAVAIPGIAGCWIS